MSSRLIPLVKVRLPEANRRSRGYREQRLVGLAPRSHRFVSEQFGLGRHGSYVQPPEQFNYFPSCSIMLFGKLSWAVPSGALVNDVTLLNPVWVDRLLAPRTTDAIRQALATWDGPVSIGGGRYSMGGQIATEHSLHLDMRRFNRVLYYSPENRVVRVQTGIRWRDLQSVIDQHDLSVKIMQS